MSSLGGRVDRRVEHVGGGAGRAFVDVVSGGEQLVYGAVGELEQLDDRSIERAEMWWFELKIRG